MGGRNRASGFGVAPRCMGASAFGVAPVDGINMNVLVVEDRRLCYLQNKSFEAKTMLQYTSHLTERIC